MEMQSFTAVAALSQIFSDRAVLLSEAHARSLLTKAAQAIRIGAHKAENNNGDPVDGAGAVETVSEIAVIPVNGILTKTPTWADEYFGLCPAYGVMDQLAGALADGNVKAIVLDIDTPGGFVNGTVELADYIATAKESKPIMAVIRGLCCSGGYWLASQCTKIIARPESEVGNIGVYSVLTDVSKFYSEIGIDLTLIASGQFKGLGADGKVSEDYVSDTRRIITGLYQQFVSAVAKGRGLSPEEAQAISDGKAYLGPQALKLGLIDEVATSFDAAIQTVSTAATAANRSSTMSKSASTAVKAATEETTGTSAEDLKSEMNSTISSANDHKDQSRKMLDAYTAKTDDLDDDTKSLAKQTVTALRAASEEAERCAEAIDDDTDPDEDPDDPGEDKGDEESANKGKGGKPQAFKASDYIAAFGDTGARWFYEKKPFTVATAEYVTQLKAEHKSQIDALTAERDSLKQKLESMDRGNEAASFSVSGADQTAAKGKQKLNGMTPGVQSYANSIKLPTAPPALPATK